MNLQFLVRKTALMQSFFVHLTNNVQNFIKYDILYIVVKGMVSIMGREIPLKEIENTLSQYEEIDEPIVVKRENKSDVVILSMKEYKEKLLELDIIKHLQKSEEDIENGRTVPAKKVFEELRAEYGY